MNESKDNITKMYNDILQNHIGFGKWQFSIFVCLYFIMNSPFVFYPTFALTVIPPHRCKIKELEGTNGTHNLTFREISQITVPLKANRNEPPVIGQEYQPCQQYNSTWIDFVVQKLKFSDLNSTIDTLYERSMSEYVVPCQEGYSFDSSSRHEYQGTAVESFQLICDRSYLIPLSTTLFMLGQMVSCALNGYLSDKFGRRKVVLICSVFVYISGFCVSFAPNIVIFIILRTVLGFTMMGVWNSGWVLMAETSNEKQRNAIMAVLFISFSFFFFGLFVASAYLFQDWRWLHMALMVFAAPSMILFILLPESPRWLLVNNHYGEFVKVLNKAKKMNKSNFTSNNMFETSEIQVRADRLKEMNDNNPHSSIQSNLSHQTPLQLIKNELKGISILLRVRILRKQSLIVFYQWFMIGIVFFGLVLNSVTINGNPYLTIWLLSFGSIPAAFMQFFLYHRFGRRAPFQISLAIAAVMLIGSSIYQYFYKESELDFVLIISVLIGKSMIDCTYSMAYIWTAELYPTQVRNYALGVSSALKSIGYAVAPYIVQLGESLGRPVPLLVFGCMALISVVCNLALSETKNRPLCDTVEEMIKYSRKSQIVQLQGSSSDEVVNEETSRDLIKTANC